MKDKSRFAILVVIIFFWLNIQSLSGMYPFTEGTFPIYTENKKILSDEYMPFVETKSEVEDSSNNTYYAAFSYAVQPGNTVVFTDESTGNELTYLWNFGDGETSNEKNPLHLFENADLYLITLSTVSDDNSDYSFTEFDFPVEISEQQGVVYAGASLLPAGKVYSYIVDTTGQQASFLAATKDVSDGWFILDNNEYDYSRVIYAIPELNLPENHYPEYFPTYYGDVFYWEDENLKYVPESGTLGIKLVCRDGIFYGSGSISGTVNSGDYDQSDLVNATILLLDKEQKPLKYTRLGDNFSFKLKNIPYGDYYLLTDKVGIHDKLHPVSIKEEICDLTISYTIGNTNYASSGFSVADYQFLLFPNPCQEWLNIEYIENCTQSEPVQINIFNCFGENIYSKSVTFSENKIRLNMNNYSQGIYFIVVGNSVFRILKSD